MTRGGKSSSSYRGEERRGREGRKEDQRGGRVNMMRRERDRERKRMIERGLTFACQQEYNDADGIGEEEEEEDVIEQRIEVGNMVGGELGALLQELAGLQTRLASLMEKMGSLPLDVIRDMRQEVVEVTDQLRNINRSHRR